MVLNLNIGILGHVDSGKTSLTKLLSEVASTAAFDKNPQSQERGITIDLGFSSFTIETPANLKTDITDEKIQYTLVDCPGHASLIKTILGGAQIIDMMLLIVDINKGIQTQTAECLVIGEITCKKMIVVLNKIDLVEESKRLAFIDKMKRKILNTLNSTTFAGLGIPVVATSAKSNTGITDLIETIAKFTEIPIRQDKGDFLFAVDHCFGIKGQGTVLTGTILSGCVKLNDTVEIPILKTSKKVKSLQMFKKPVSIAKQGDRLGICVAQFDPKLMERGIVCSPGVCSFTRCAIIEIKRVKYYKNTIESKVKFHVTIGHETVMANITLFSQKNTDHFDNSLEYLYKPELLSDDNSSNETLFALLEFEKPVLVVDNSKIIGSKLDMDSNTTSCRIAFYGVLLTFCKNDSQQFLQSLKIFKVKTKIGTVDRVMDDANVIVKNMFKKQTDLSCFLGLKVRFSSGEVGRIESSFGQSGKVKIYLENKLLESTIRLFDKSNKEDNVKQNVQVILEFKRFMFDQQKIICQ